MLKTLLNFLITFLSRPQSQPGANPKPSVPASPQNPPQSQPQNLRDTNVEIDWKNPTAKISKHFTVHEATYLPSWNVYHTPSEQEKENIVKLALVMDKIRDYIGKPIIIHVWIRPILNSPGHEKHGQDYNLFVKGAKMSAHKTGLGVDWHAKDYSCDYVRRLLQQKLEEFNIRVEDLPGSNWVHTDIKTPVNNNRYFKP